MPSPEVIRLRALLTDAASLAGSLGDDARQEPPGVGYFADDGTSGIAEAINAIGGHDGEITLFVGAGVSMEAELPSWNALVRELLIKASGANGPDEVVERWAATVLEEGPLAAAAVAESLYPDEVTFRQALRTALYHGAPELFAPGALAGQIAWLKKRLGHRLAILTVNYDGLLEAGLRDCGLSVKSYVRGRSEPEGEAAVWHLHGRLVRDARGTNWDRPGNLVLSEGSYVSSTTRPFPQQFVQQRLANSLCVFVGLSMTDPNFIRWLYNAERESELPRYVIFVRQASEISDQRVRTILERSAVARWSRYGVTPVWANYYGEVAQIIHEIGLHSNGNAPTEFAARARERLKLGAAQLSPPDPDVFAGAQAAASLWLRRRLDGIREICASADPPVELGDHHLGLGLWAVDHDTGMISNWASSDRAYQEPDAVIPSPLNVQSRWVSAVAIANGVSVEQDPMVYASRWRFIRGIPIIVDGGGERSIAGALTLTSTTPLSQCPLAKHNAPAGLLGEIDKYLSGQASEFFLP